MLNREVFAKQNPTDVEFFEETKEEIYATNVQMDTVVDSDSGKLHNVVMSTSWQRGKKNNQFNLSTYVVDQSENVSNQKGFYPH